MVLQVVLNKDGNYEYKDVAPPKATPVLNNEFEAYEKKQETKLAGDTNIGEQTQQLIRETPGQYTTSFNEETGQFETTEKGSEVTSIPFQQSTTNIIPEPQETALQKVQRITAATKPSSPVDFRGELAAMQDKAIKAQRINTLIKGGFDLGAAYLRYGTGQGTAMNIMPTTQLIMVPLGLILVSSLGLGLGLMFSGLNTLNRDIEHLFRIITRAGLFLSPVMWTVKMLPESRQSMVDYLMLNPMVVPISMIRSGFDGTELGIDTFYIVYSVAFCLTSLILGSMIFKRYESVVVKYL